MTVSLEWMDQDHTQLYIKVNGGSPYEDFIAAAEELRAMLSSVSHPVDVICDIRMHFMISPRMLEIAQTVHNTTYPNLRMVVFVGRKLVWEMFLIFARQFKAIPYSFVGVDDEDEAMAVIQRVRQEAVIAAGMASAPLN